MIDIVEPIIIVIEKTSLIRLVQCFMIFNLGKLALGVKIEDDFLFWVIVPNFFYQIT